MALFGNKKKNDLPTKPALKTMDQLVTSFTSEAQTIADAQAGIEAKEEEAIRKATEKRDAARTEKRKADNFIKNFAALADEPEPEPDTAEVADEK